MSKKYYFEDRIEFCQIKINESEYNKKIVRLIEGLLEIDEAEFKAETLDQRQAA